MSRLFFQPNTRLGVNRFRLYPSLAPRDLFSHRALFLGGEIFHHTHGAGTRLCVRAGVRQYFDAEGAEFSLLFLSLHSHACSTTLSLPQHRWMGAEIIDIGTPLDIESAARSKSQHTSPRADVLN